MVRRVDPIPAFHCKSGDIHMGFTSNELASCFKVVSVIGRNLNPFKLRTPVKIFTCSTSYQEINSNNYDTKKTNGGIGNNANRPQNTPTAGFEHCNARCRTASVSAHEQMASSRYSTYVPPVRDDNKPKSHRQTQIPKAEFLAPEVTTESCWRVEDSFTESTPFCNTAAVAVHPESSY